MMDPSVVSGSSPGLENEQKVSAGQTRLAAIAADSGKDSSRVAADADQPERFSQRLSRARTNSGDDSSVDNPRSTKAAGNPAASEKVKTKDAVDTKLEGTQTAEVTNKLEAEQLINTENPAPLEELPLSNAEVLPENELPSEIAGTVPVTDIDEQNQATSSEQLKASLPNDAVSLKADLQNTDSGDGEVAQTAQQINLQQAGAALSPVEVPVAAEQPAVVAQQVSLSDKVSQLFKRSAELTAGERSPSSGMLRYGAEAANTALINMREAQAPLVPVMDEALVEEALASIKENATTKVVTTRVERMTELEAAMQANASAPVAKSALSQLSSGAGAPLNINIAAIDQPSESIARAGSVPGTNLNAAATASRELPALPAFAGDNIRLMLQQGLSRATLMLHPAELGALKINLDVQSDQLNVQIVASQSATRDALEQAMPKMRAQLQQGGFGEVNIDLSNSHTNSQQQQSDQAFQFRQDGPSLPDAGVGGMPSQLIMSDANAMPVPPVSVRLVDLFA